MSNKAENNSPDKLNTEKSNEDGDVDNFSDSSESFHSTSQEEKLEFEDECRDFSTPDFMKESQECKDFLNKEGASEKNSRGNSDERDKKYEKYFIDETSLQEFELNLSEECKKDYHTIALNLKTEGNELFKKEDFEQAAMLYTKALKTCPLAYTEDRAIFYGNRAAARAKIDKDQIKEAIKDCGKSIELNPNYCKVILRRAKLHQDIDNLDEALKDFQRVLELEPTNSEARQATFVLPDKINERNEKMKEEMMGKLKELGNLCLKPFGLSTNNFEMKQDPNSGGYSINFKQNPT